MSKLQLLWVPDWKNITSLKAGKTRRLTTFFASCLFSSISSDLIHDLVYVHNRETLWSVHGIQAGSWIWWPSVVYDPHLPPLKLMTWVTSGWMIQESWLMVLQGQLYWEEQPGKEKREKRKENVLDGKIVPDPETIIHHDRKTSFTQNGIWGPKLHGVPMSEGCQMYVKCS